MKTLDDLVAIIRANPGCTVVLDNDCWWIYAAPANPSEQDEPREVARSSDFDRSVSHVYGQGVLDALAVIQGITVEGV